MKTAINGLLLFYLLFLTACGETIIGQFQANDNIQIHEEKKDILIPKGNYKAEINVTLGKSEAKVKVDLTTKEKNKINFKFLIPTNQIPENSNFIIPKSVTGQDFDIIGMDDTRIIDSRPVFESEHCRYERQICRTGRKNGRPVTYCYTEFYHGRRHVEYVIRTHIRDTGAQLKPDEDSILGTFNAHSEWSEKYYTFQGHCF